MKKDLIQDTKGKNIFTIDTLLGATPELLIEYLETAFTELENSIMQILYIFRGPLSVRRMRSIMIQKTVGNLCEDVRKYPRSSVEDKKRAEFFLARLNYFYLKEDFPNLIGNEDIQLKAPTAVSHNLIKFNTNLKEFENINSEFLLSEKLAEYLSKAGIPVYGMKRIQDALENLKRSGFIMERKQSPTNNTRLFFLNPRMTIFLRKLFEKKK